MQRLLTTDDVVILILDDGPEPGDSRRAAQIVRDEPDPASAFGAWDLKFAAKFGTRYVKVIWRRAGIDRGEFAWVHVRGLPEGSLEEQSCIIVARPLVAPADATVTERQRVWSGADEEAFVALELDGVRYPIVSWVGSLGREDIR